jgi:hydrogenase maturation protease
VGTVHRFDASARPLPARVFRGSTHAFGLADAVELGRALHTLPATVIVHGVEGRAFGAGEELSGAVASAVERAAQAVLDDLERLGEEEERCTNEH